MSERLHVVMDFAWWLLSYLGSMFIIAFIALPFWVGGFLGNFLGYQLARLGTALVGWGDEILDYLNKHEND